ncbi:monooxygenase [Aspergillus sclerotioniger CBS 115572]|uniref:Monooxygenase n=1 Tax=Aspergillus sclerotioniger CBS 115572 TaxID=1450535 RepID=A0A317XBI1_9EURO|nr:monooxygenase [Aspergillus sclerotioniger CBS 115572]PWY93910.1 monooxygenase [Aspergillus sclerotioniger CBS 115572]
MSKTDSQRPFHVVIVGASVAGLTLAHCLSSTSIEFTILEARSDSFSDGAGLAILPNGARILDQLGLYQDVLDQGQCMVSHSTWLEDGRLLRRVDARHLRSIGRTNYPFIIISRRALLGILYTRLQRRSCVSFNKRVSRIVSSTQDVMVYTADGSSVSGDLVVGADGVYSTVRTQMWHHIKNVEDASTRSHRLSEVPLTDAFGGVFGISQSIPGLERGNVHRTYGRGWSIIIMIGADSKVFWFIAIARTGTDQAMPHRSSDRVCVAGIIEPLLEKHVTFHVKFGEVFNHAESCILVPLEESFQAKWSWGRFVGIGDAMTPNLAEGANCGMESAASLANYLSSFTRGSTALYTQERLGSTLKTWEDSRKRRTKSLFIVSQCAVRIEATTSWVLRLLQTFLGLIHVTGIGLLTDITSRTARVDYLPLPSRKGVERIQRDKEQEPEWNIQLSTLPLTATVSLVFYVLHAVGM